MRIMDKYENKSRIRISFVNGNFTVVWPQTTDISENDRAIKVHAAIKHSFENDNKFKGCDLTKVKIKSDIAVSRLDKFDTIGLTWEVVAKQG
jgi:hypothetical protein